MYHFFYIYNINTIMNNGVHHSILKLAPISHLVNVKIKLQGLGRITHKNSVNYIYVEFKQQVKLQSCTQLLN